MKSPFVYFGGKRERVWFSPHCLDQEGELAL